MRTSMKYEVVRDDFGLNTITDKGLVFTITLGKKDTEEMMHDFIKKLSTYIDLDLTGGHFEDNFYQVGWIEMDREDFADYKELYMDFKKEYTYNSSIATQAIEEVREKEIIEIAKQYVSLNKEEKENFINKQISSIIKGEEEHTIFNWVCDILTNADYVQEALEDKSWMYYDKFTRLYNLIMEA